MPGVHHAAFTGRFADLLRGKVLAMELDKEVGALLDARWDGIDHAKELDLSYKPIIIRTPDDWPSVIVETGVSQTLPKLRLDAKWWIENSGREVKTAILIKIYRKTRRVFLEEWQYVTMRKPSTRRTPASTTSGPRRVQLVTINFLPGGRPVAGGPFTIGFRNLMLRDPRLPRPPRTPHNNDDGNDDSEEGSEDDGSDEGGDGDGKDASEPEEEEEEEYGGGDGGGGGGGDGKDDSASEEEEEDEEDEEEDEDEEEEEEDDDDDNDDDDDDEDEDEDEDAGSGEEGDFVFTKEELEEEFARHVWKTCGDCD